MIKKLKK